MHVVVEWTKKNNNSYTRQANLVIIGALMPTRKPPQPDDPEQYRRFLETAKEVEADDTPGSLDRHFDLIVRPRKRKPEKPKED
jgi:hypothetical protein